MTSNYFYLHGFASAPHTTKGRFFADKFTALGHTLRIPDLNTGDFSHLTLTRMIDVLRQALADCPDGPVYLLASSMGALVATHLVARYRQAEAANVYKMLFMAPAFDFMHRREQDTTGRLERWRSEGQIEVFHYGYQKTLPIHYGLVEDLQSYDSFAADVDGLPILIFHGRWDESVPHQQSLRFAQGRENVQVHLVESDHLLHDQLPAIWQACVEFFDLAGNQEAIVESSCYASS